jgi:chorismate-pyruvate lyase
MNLLFPLDTFYHLANSPLPEVEEVEGEDVPQPYRQLLVGCHDMTPTLAAFHRDEIDLQVVERLLEGDALSRLVVLYLDRSGRAVEFGAIVINLQHFPEEARDDILTGRYPLGTVLARHEIKHSSCPQAFIKVQSDETMNAALHLTRSAALYGRRNYLLTPEKQILADILELLPPEPH